MAFILTLTIFALVTLVSQSRYEAIWAIQKVWNKKAPLEGELEVHYEFYFENHQGEPDTSNCIEGPQDCLQEANVIKNDKQIKKLVAEKFFGTEPRTIIKIYSLPERLPNGVVG